MTAIWRLLLILALVIPNFTIGRMMYLHYFSYRQGPAQDAPLFYLPSNLSELKSCKSIFSTDFLSFSYLNSA